MLIATGRRSELGVCPEGYGGRLIGIRDGWASIHWRAGSSYGWMLGLKRLGRTDGRICDIGKALVIPSIETGAPVKRPWREWRLGGMRRLGRVLGG